jgi:predicted enzyme related to lactoylglutathione lyase
MMKVGMVTVVVTDQEKALAFWTEKLGWEKRMDAQAGPKARWLTVGAAGQDVHVILWDPTQWMPAEAAQAALATIGKGGSMVLNTEDCRALHAELSGKGVEFVQAPVDRQYGIEAIFKDPFGNSFVVTQPKWG